MAAALQMSPRPCALQVHPAKFLEAAATSSAVQWARGDALASVSGAQCLVDFRTQLLALPQGSCWGPSHIQALGEILRVFLKPSPLSKSSNPTLPP